MLRNRGKGRWRRHQLIYLHGEFGEMIRIHD
jgi:hypothetical protein